jgi:hypothetical protein
MFEFHITAILHAKDIAGINSDEKARLYVIDPAISTKCVPTRQHELIILIKGVIAN